ncbi:hypothetical protein JX265_002711 [Neoarthrinium moseri]|uniref:Uncharacterized protein n=1 Tax=Neoarthrinium moseri TaxID=1658444 RepID=A0A9P9WUY2_9PEZI|nr:hypothetical protein JX266_011146 [Neoarthrinium moseri]KAI1879757.1 hypothetical protein JX265_002711 [Neoarthrinium moseri]
MPSPMIKATLAAAALSSASNIMAQILEAYRAGQALSFDGPHFLRFVVLSFLTAPPNYKWQQFLEASFPAYEHKHGGGGGGGASDLESQRKEKREDDEVMGLDYEDAAHERKPKLNLRNTFAKWFIDCITLGAIMNTVAFFVLMGLLKHQSMAQIGHNVRHETIPLIVAGYKIWPFASIISFSCVPVERRIVFLSFVGLLWGIYMSLVAARV